MAIDPLFPSALSSEGGKEEEREARDGRCVWRAGDGVAGSFVAVSRRAARVRFILLGENATRGSLCPEEYRKVQGREDASELAPVAGRGTLGEKSLVKMLGPAVRPRDGQTGSLARPGPGEARSVLGLARQTRLENRAGLTKHTVSISCPSSVRGGPKRAGTKKRAKKRAMRAGNEREMCPWAISKFFGD
jgi:hypothetical protein